MKPMRFVNSCLLSLSLVLVCSCSQKSTTEIVNECTNRIASRFKDEGFGCQRHRYCPICIDSAGAQGNVFALYYSIFPSDSVKSVKRKDSFLFYNNTGYVIDGDAVCLDSINDSNLDYEEDFDSVIYVALINVKTGNYRILCFQSVYPSLESINQLQEFIDHPNAPFKNIQRGTVDWSKMPPPPPPIP